MKDPTWTEIAREAVREMYTSIKLVQPDLSDDEILRMVSLHYYPFGERKYWPYKAGLKVLKEFKASLVSEKAIEPMEGPLFK